MTYQLLNLPVEQLRLDPRNPRLWGHEPTDDQDKIAQALQDESYLDDMMKDMAQGIYGVAPHALLALEEEGGLTVVDGNRRLLSIRLLTEPDFAKRNARKTVPGIDEGTAQALRKATVVVMESWEKIHRVRVRQQLAGGSKWRTLIHAQDFRRMLRNEDSPADLYRVHPHTVSEWVNALNFLEQVNSVAKEPWNKTYQFSLLIKALAQPAIRESLGLQEAESYKPDQKPLTNEKTAQGIGLMVHLHGPMVKEKGKHTSPKVRSEHELQYLGRVYSNEKALDRMNSWDQYTAKDVCDWLDGFPNPHRIIELAEQIHAAAVRELREIKDEKPELVPHPGMIHVAHASHTIYNDRSTQYMVHLKSKSPETHREASDLLQKRLRSKGGYDCLVDFE
jgi:hypothetical protein